jgi:hypothetical protein
MKAILEIELRGDDQTQLIKLWTSVANECVPGMGTAAFGGPIPRRWVAEITGPDRKWKYARSFCRFKKDYSRANSKGSRGVYAIYCLDGSKYYEVNEWKRRFFCKVRDWKVVEVTKEEVDEWLKSNSASTSLKQLANG